MLQPHCLPLLLCFIGQLHLIMLDFRVRNKIYNGFASFSQKFSMQIIHIPWASGKNLVQASQCIVFAPMLLSNLFELLLSILCVLHCPSRLIAAQIIPKLSCFGLNNALAVVPPSMSHFHSHLLSVFSHNVLYHSWNSFWCKL